jgi:hypothetical protein
MTMFAVAACVQTHLEHPGSPARVARQEKRLPKSYPVHVAGWSGNTVTRGALRHSFATHMLDNGAELPVIQVLLGHDDPRDTMAYLHLSTRKLKTAPNPLEMFDLAGQMSRSALAQFRRRCRSRQRRVNESRIEPKGVGLWSNTKNIVLPRLAKLQPFSSGTPEVLIETLPQ